MTGTEAYRRAPPTMNQKMSNTRARQQQPPISTELATGFRTKTERGALITSSLPSLQNLIKRSPESYAEEFAVQWARFGSLVKIVQLGLGGAKADEDKLREVTGFICQVSWRGIIVSFSSPLTHAYPGCTLVSDHHWIPSLDSVEPLALVCACRVDLFRFDNDGKWWRWSRRWRSPAQP